MFMLSLISPQCLHSFVQEKLSEKRRLLHQLEKQERDFLGSDKKCKYINLWCYSEFISTPGKLINMFDHGGNRTYDLWNASPMLCHVGSFPSVVRHRLLIVCDLYITREAHVFH